MQFSELVTDSLFLSGTVSSQYKDEDNKRNINFHYDDLVLEIWRADGSWKFDEGVGTLPIIYGDLEKDQRDYQLPTEARRIEGVEILYNDTRIKLDFINPEDTTTHELKTGQPRYYYSKGRSVFLFPAPDKDVEEGLFMYISKSVTQLEDDTDEPKIDREFHRYLSMGAARDWHFARGNVNKARELERRMNETKEEVKSFYSRRQQEGRPKFKVKRNYKNYL